MSKIKVFKEAFQAQKEVKSQPMTKKNTKRQKLEKVQF